MNFQIRSSRGNHRLAGVLGMAGVLAFLILIPDASAQMNRPTKRQRIEHEFSKTGTAATADYNSVRDRFIEKDYASVDRQAEQYLAYGRGGAETDDVVYLQAMSLEKSGHATAAREKLRILERSSRSSEVKAAASSSIGDSFSGEGDKRSAWSAYEETLRKYPTSEQTAYVLYRLSALGADAGHAEQANQYAQKLMREYPGTAEAQQLRAHSVADVSHPKEAVLPEGLTAETPGSSGQWYCVQVGSFSKAANATALVQKLISQGHQAYIVRREWGTMFRVRVGKLQSRREAVLLESRLAKEGYPTKIFP